MNVTQFTNPIVEQRADPWVYRHTDEYYYFTASGPEYDRIDLRRARALQDLGTAEATVVWRKYDSGPMSAHVWAPEIHYIKGKWYIYFAAARVDAPFDHRTYVLENEASNPVEGTWVQRGPIQTQWESFTIDATSFEHTEVHYLVWAQKIWRSKAVQTCILRQGVIHGPLAEHQSALLSPNTSGKLSALT